MKHRDKNCQDIHTRREVGTGPNPVATFKPVKDFGPSTGEQAWLPGGGGGGYQKREGRNQICDLGRPSDYMRRGQAWRHRSGRVQTYSLRNPSSAPTLILSIIVSHLDFGVAYSLVSRQPPLPPSVSLYAARGAL